MLEDGKGRQGKGRPKKMLHRETFYPVKLKELGISRVQSSRWQSIAALPKKDFEGYIQDNRQGQKIKVARCCFETFQLLRLTAGVLWQECVGDFPVGPWLSAGCERNVRSQELTA